MKMEDLGLYICLSVPKVNDGFWYITWWEVAKNCYAAGQIGIGGVEGNKKPVTIDKKFLDSL